MTSGQFAGWKIVLTYLSGTALVSYFICINSINYFADLRMTFRQNFFLQDWFRNKFGVGLGLGFGLELVFGVGLVLVKPLLCYVLSL
jgi:hypothetical protein